MERAAWSPFLADYYALLPWDMENLTPMELEAISEDVENAVKRHSF